MNTIWVIEYRVVGGEWRIHGYRMTKDAAELWVGKNTRHSVYEYRVVPYVRAEAQP